MTDEERLALALERARVRVKSGIGTQSEKLVHQTLKYFLEPDESCHEVRIGSYTADIFQRETGRIFEIQTRGFDRLRDKLSVFLEEYPVTLVYPCTAIKYLNWIDPDTGEVGKRHRSPRKGRPSDVLPEIYRLMDLWNHENLEIMVLMIDMEEFRLQDGYGKDNKHGSHRYERIPLAIDRYVRLKETKDYLGLLPEELEESFDRQSLMKALKLGGMKGSYAVTMLERAGAIERCGMKGKRILYRTAAGTEGTYIDEEGRKEPGSGAAEEKT